MTESKRLRDQLSLERKGEDGPQVLGWGTGQMALSVSQRTPYTLQGPLGQGTVGEDMLGFRLVEWEGSVVTVMEMCSR